MLRLKKTELEKPLHVALTLDGSKKWAESNKKSLQESFRLKFDKLFDFLQVQIEQEIPIMTFYLLTKNQDYIQEYIDEMKRFLEKLKNSEYLNKHHIKVSVVGKWYHLPADIVELIKQLIDETKEYDTYFLNFCIKYNGQEEIVDACKLLARQVQAGKIEIDLINEAMIKENIYTSYFLPPKLIIKTGSPKNTSLLLWDSVYAKTVYTNKPWQDFTKKDFMKAIG